MSSEKDKKKRSFRKEYLNDFKKNDSGSYEYSGEYKTYKGSGADWRRDILIMWLSCAIPAILLLIIGFITESGLTGNFLIIIPYALELIALFLLIWKLVRLTYGGMRLRNYVHKSILGYLPGFASAAAVIAGLALAGLIVTLISGNFSGSLFALIIYASAQIFLIIGCFLILKVCRNMDWN